MASDAPSPATGRRSFDPGAVRGGTVPVVLVERVLVSEPMSTRLPVIDPRAERIASALASRMRGGVRAGLLDRALYATDASPYEVLPIAVASPVDADDLAAAVAWCGEEGVPLLPRGAGTSLAGQTVGAAVVLDCSTHLHRIHEIDPARRIARVEPGVVLDDLRRAAARFGLGVGPDVSTATHATIGGMIGNSSAGAMSLVHGMTDEHVVEIDGVLADGSRHRFGAIHPDRSCGDARLDGLARGLVGVVRPLADEIRARFPAVPRNVAGYRLDDVLDRLVAGDGAVDLARFLAGTEGTLAVTAAATMRLVPLPGSKALLVAGFASVADACARVAALVATGPVAVELMDAFIVEAAAAQPVFAADVALLPTIDGRRPGAVLLVEYHGDDPAEAAAKASAAVAAAGLDAGATAVFGDAAVQSRIWSVRTTGLGLISKPDGTRSPMPGLEDCGVPLDRLADFQIAFERLIGSHGWRGVFYAHASVGLLHVRPRIDLDDRQDRDGFRRLREETLDLVLAHGGSISGEHGDGRIRADLVRRMYGPRIVEAFTAVKALFDPAGILNPGIKVGDPDPLADLRHDHEQDPDGGVGWHFRWDGPGEGGGPLAMSRACNGNGLCRRHDGGAMCPSYRALLDEHQATRGRANALRLALEGRLGESRFDRDDVLEVLSPCLSCKACRHECPSNVDLGRLKAEYVAQSKGDRRTWRDRTLGAAGLHLRRAARHRGLARLLASLPGAESLVARLLRLDPTRPLPRPAARDADRPARRHAASDAPVVAVLDDCFTNALEPGIVADTVRVLDAFGWRVERVALAGCCGRPQVSSGLLREARALIETSAPRLAADLDACGAVALVVPEPSCLSALREEWVELDTSVPIAVVQALAATATSIEGFLDGRWNEHPRRPDLATATGVVVHPHCHAKVRRGEFTRLLGRLGLPDADVLDSGCCGLAGSFGYLAEHADLTRTIFRQSLGDRLDASPPGTLVAAGTSCRHQCADLGGVEAIHPATLLANLLAD